jgi:hypothetical protein
MPCHKLVNEIDKLQRKTNDSDLLGPLGKLRAKFAHDYMKCDNINEQTLSDTLYDVCDDNVDKLDELLSFIDKNKSDSPEINKLLNTPVEGGKSRRHRRRHSRRSTRKHARKSRRHRRRHSRRYRK